MPANRKARAIYDYDARAPDELTFKRNDLIEVFGLDEEDEGWYKGRLNGIEGLFPNNYVHFMEEVPAPAAAPSKPTSSGPVAPTPPPTTPPAPAASGLPESVKVQKFEASYALAEVLGRGRFSQVRRCTHTASKRSCAVKIMELDDPELGANEKDAEKEILAEVKVLRMVQHANIVELLETIKEGKRYHLVLEDLDGGDLFDRIEQNGPYKEDDAALLMRQVVTAVDYLHAKGIVHRDLKPDNLVFTTKAPDARMKIIDFGYAGFCSASAPLRGLCGTPDYAAPEILTW
jgi:serine/threonine protein kinase